MSTHRLKQYGSWAVITGSTGGIGAEFATQLAAHDFNLVLVSRNEEKLLVQAEQLAEKYGIKTKVVQANLADRNSIGIIMAAIDNIDIGLLINNAGFALTGRFLDTPVERSIELLDVNCTAPLALMHAIGTIMRDKNKGAIINVASASAFLPIPFWSMYSASKVMLLHLSEALWHEFKKDNIDVLALCPGSTNTEFSKKAGAGMQGGGAVQQVVSEGLNYIGKKPSHTVGGGNKFAQLVVNILSRKMRISIGSKIIGETATTLND